MVTQAPCVDFYEIIFTLTMSSLMLAGESDPSYNVLRTNYNYPGTFYWNYTDITGLNKPVRSQNITWTNDDRAQFSDA